MATYIESKIPRHAPSIDSMCHSGKWYERGINQRMLCAVAVDSVLVIDARHSGADTKSRFSTG